ncbi:MAG: TraR/DksA family transcriptional regulator [Shimia sp.]|uniref:TraR/DksA family transcriptional regulator n=1 Tax=Shimia sp. TaxID=1954381 RepID=UPI00405811CE
MLESESRKEALLARMAELDQRMHDIEAELDAPHSKDVEDHALEIEGEEVLEVLGLQSQQEAIKIRAALGRLQSGEYGACFSCGEEIAPERLDLLPETTLCVACASAARRHN